MTVKFGPNSAQVEAFARVAALLDPLTMPRLTSSDADVKSARQTVLRVRPSGSVTMALSSAEDRLIGGLRRRAEQKSAYEPALEIKLIPLVACHKAFAFRPQLSDDIVAKVVDPFCEYTGFEWRSWGVSSEGDLGPEQT